MAWLKLPWFTRRRSARLPHRDVLEPHPHPSDPPRVAGAELGIVMYGTPWCGDCRRAKRVFAELAVAYAYVDIENDPDAAALVMRLNDGMRTVPTILFPDGSVLVEPGRGELAEKLAAYAA